MRVTALGALVALLRCPAAATLASGLLGLVLQQALAQLHPNPPLSLTPILTLTPTLSLTLTLTLTHLEPNQALAQLHVLSASHDAAASGRGAPPRSASDVASRTALLQLISVAAPAALAALSSHAQPEASCPNPEPDPKLHPHPNPILTQTPSLTPTPSLTQASP